MKLPSSVRRSLSFARVTGALPIVIVSSIAVALLAARIAFTGRLTFVFLVWNLFLAWIPVVLALPFERRSIRVRTPGLVVLGIAWLAFLPNAPYLLTDFVHLRSRPEVPIAFDATLLVAFAAAGFLSMTASLRAVQDAVSRRVGDRAGWVFAFVVLTLCGVGMYVGRVLRWNSWDVIARPRDLVRVAWSAALDPVGHARALVFSAGCALVSLAVYSVTRGWLSATSIADSGARARDDG